MLRVLGLEAGYGHLRVLHGVDLEVGRAEVVSLLGRNGMGKTTTINAVLGIVPCSAGRVLFDDREIQGLPSYRVARLGVGLVPEGRQVFPNLSVKENLVATRVERRGEGHWTLDAVLDMFPELRERLGMMGNLLSGGEQQMLAIGRALLTNPRLLILDEATEGLAPLVRAKIWRCLVRLKGMGQSILVIDKNLADLLDVADRHYVMEKGRIVFGGDGAMLRAKRGELERYLGV